MTPLETAVQELLDRLNRIENKLNDLYMDQKSIFDMDEAASYLSVSKSFLYKLTSGKQIPHNRSEGRKKIYFMRSDLDAWRTQTHIPTNTEIKRLAAIQLQQYDQKRKQA